MDAFDDFIENLLTRPNIQLQIIEWHKDEDKLCTFLQFMISRCIIRFAPNYLSGGVYVFSNPGRIIMEDKIKRQAFIEEFEKFYNS